MDEQDVADDVFREQRAYRGRRLAGPAMGEQISDERLVSNSGQAIGRGDAEAAGEGGDVLAQESRIIGFLNGERGGKIRRREAPGDDVAMIDGHAAASLPQ